MSPGLVTTHKEKILVVDDEQSLRDLLLVFFRKNFYQVAAARDATEGLLLAAEMQPTVAIIDYRIAGGGGINLIKKLRTELPETKTLFMTAFEDQDLFDQAMKAGAWDYIRKPFDLLRLLAKVENLIASNNVILLETRSG